MSDYSHASERLLIDTASVADNAVSITPSDSSDLSPWIRALYIGGAGNVSVITAGGQTVTFSGLPAGTILPLHIRRVNATGTTATSLVGLY